MVCKNCKSDRIAQVNGKTSDLCFVSMADAEKDGDVPRDMGIGGGDYIKFAYCLDCGQIQNSFPLPECKLEKKKEDDN